MFSKVYKISTFFGFYKFFFFILLFIRAISLLTLTYSNLFCLLISLLVSCSLVHDYTLLCVNIRLFHSHWFCMSD